ncbi:MAG: NAD-dependent epimerase/dehydratase family protein [Candidatus Pacebacteria bacterium]|nr:NAD-dependent epimerase/dehydratase family protein [Candidatus Paceibacterota bacterium]
MKTLVTGGAGFIGSHIVDRLIAEGHDVKILDSLENRVHPKGKPSYIPKEAEFIGGDVCNKDDLKKALKDVNVVFHQSAYQDYMPNYSKFIHTNAVSTALIYEIINEDALPVEKVIVASSQAVYGEGQYQCKEQGLIQPPTRSQTQLEKGDWELHCPICDEYMDPLRLSEEYANPYNQYALSKYNQELIATRLGRLLNIPTVALRYSITQGPRQSLYNQYSGICRIFSLRLLNGKPPIIYEDGKQQRDYVHISDVVDANMLVLRSDEANFQVFNVGSGVPVTVLEYAQLLTKKLDKEIEPLVLSEYRLGDNRHSVSDISKLKKLGWFPKKGLEDIFDDYIAWVKELGDLGEYFEEADKMMRKMNVIRRARDGK